MKPTPLLTIITIAGAITASSIATSQAAISITQVGATDTWTLSFDEITFTANGNAGDMAWLVFEDIYTSNSTVQGEYVGGSSTISFSVNGGGATVVTPQFKNGTFDITLGAIDANDAFVNLAGVGPDPSNGDTVAISGSMQFTSVDVPSLVAGPIDVSFWDNGGTGLLQAPSASVTVVPEPSSTALLGLG